MQIVIDIPEDVYIARKYGEISPWVTGTILDAVEQGTPLPKGHGRLKDIDKLKSDGDIVTNYNYRSAVSWEQIIDAPTVLEADIGDAE